ncbi:hypothetical protein WKH56_12540 [Priestia sp. SB1]|uniref:hypothetical protein n=1 Tax=Priestia sp. SB1 TaxID=3132359 RepID=UPI00317E704C
MYKKMLIPILGISFIFAGCSADNTAAPEKQNKSQVEDNKSKSDAKIENATIENGKDNVLEVKAKATGKGVEYAYYVYKGEDIIKKVYYTSNTSFKYKAKEPGEYKVTVFVQDKTGKRISKDTDTVTIN